MNERVLLIGNDIAPLRFLAGELADVAHVCGIIVEPKVPFSRILTRRIKAFGIVNALGQAAFVALVLPLIRYASRTREETIARETGMESHPISVPVRDVPSVNAPATLACIQEFAPSVVVVYGTRIVTGKTLRAANVPFINVHAGLTPWYRGGHGAYWAFYNREPERAGVTVHRIDTGIDTGGILAQASIAATDEDTIATYPLLQLAAAAQLLRGLLREGQRTWDEKHSDATPLRALYAHPTIWEYFIGRLRGVK